MDADRAALIETVVGEGGKPRADAQVEVQRAIEGVQLARDHVPHQLGRQVALGHTPASAHRLAWTIREPIGPVLAISGRPAPRRATDACVCASVRLCVCVCICVCLCVFVFVCMCLSPRPCHGTAMERSDHGCTLHSVQSSSQPHCAPGGAGGGDGLPCRGQAGAGHAAVVRAPRKAAQGRRPA
jgi:hypothetical protein